MFWAILETGLVAGVRRRRIWAGYTNSALALSFLRTQESIDFLIMATCFRRDDGAGAPCAGEFHPEVIVSLSKHDFFTRRQFTISAAFR
ncbi:MAG: hypothetical protein KKA42_01245 [candidate division Zixibacteria bacterium]|nr:hypothetical protein [candidate division Zixibacteria bacterium]